MKHPIRCEYWRRLEIEAAVMLCEAMAEKDRFLADANQYWYETVRQCRQFAECRH